MAIDTGTRAQLYKFFEAVADGLPTEKREAWCRKFMGRSWHAVEHLISRNGLKSKFAEARSAAAARANAEAAKRAVEEAPKRDPKERYFELVKLAKKPGMTIERICDRLRLPPGEVKRLIASAAKDGVHITVHGPQIGFEIRDSNDELRRTKIAPIAGPVQRLGVISDTHFGSAYCMRAELRDFVEWAYHERGVRNILHPGDVLDGCYRHSQFEVLQAGLDLQVEDALKTLPQLPGLLYHAIEGNHDNTFSDAVGFHALKYMRDQFREHGRDDFRFYGSRSAYLDIQGIKVHLFHPRGSMASYAKSYNLQRKIVSYEPGQKPHVLLIGHYHQFAYVEDRGVHGMLCPTFHSGQSSFGRSLVGNCAIGGLILEWAATESGTLRNFKLEKRTYFPSEPTQRLNA